MSTTMAARDPGILFSGAMRAEYSGVANSCTVPVQQVFNGKTTGQPHFSLTFPEETHNIGWPFESTEHNSDASVLTNMRNGFDP
jgi:hypothetical protein